MSEKHRQFDAGFKRQVVKMIKNQSYSKPLHSTLGYLPPNVYEHKMAAKHPIPVFEITLPLHFETNFIFMTFGFLTLK
ncbi:MAG: hypothetical protein ACXWT3_14120 [Methylococcaceae bacterium]